MGDGTIEPIGEGDVRAVRDLVLEGLREHWGVIDPSMNPELEDIRSAYPGGCTLVVRSVAGEVIGTGTAVPRGDRIVELVRMSVDAAHRRTGIGRALVRQLIEWARGAGAHAVVLETTSTWTEVIAFYESCGFVVTHEADGPFGKDTWFRLDLVP